LGYFGVKDGVPTPARAKAIRVLSLLCEYARIDLGWIAHNPCRWPKRLQTGDGYPAWTLAEFQQYMACGQIGEPIKRAAAQAFYTGARVGDCIALPRAARHDGAIEFTPSRTKRTTRAHVVLPVVPEPAAVLDAAPASDAPTRADGQPWKIDHVKHAMAKKAVRKAGLRAGRSFHGLPSGLSVALAEGGASPKTTSAARHAAQGRCRNTQRCWSR
jgi:integrase